MGEKVEEIKKERTASHRRDFKRPIPLPHRNPCARQGGTPLKLGVKGEDLPKVMYRLLEADHYINKKILIVGGGDSAVEAAMDLRRRSATRSRSRIERTPLAGSKKETNTCGRVQAHRKMRVIFNSNPVEFKPDSVLLDVQGKVRRFPTISSGSLQAVFLPLLFSRKLASSSERAM